LSRSWLSALGFWHAGIEAQKSEAGSADPELDVRLVMTSKNPKRWIAGVTTDSTHPPPGLFTKSAATIARALASKDVSPKGPTSGMRMLNYFINRAGRGLSAERRAELEKAKALLSARIRRERSKEKGAA
jgi:tRNA(adenine34) deaminase